MDRKINMRKNPRKRRKQKEEKPGIFHVDAALKGVQRDQVGSLGPDWDAINAKVEAGAHSIGVRVLHQLDSAESRK